MVGLKLGAILLTLGASSLVNALTTPAHGGVNLAPRHHPAVPAVLERCDSCDQGNGVGVGVDIGIGVGIGGEHDPRGNGNTAGGSLDVQVRAALTLAINGCKDHVKHIVDKCHAGGDVSADIKASLSAIIEIVVDLKIKLEAFAKAGFKGSAGAFKAEISLLLEIFASICIAISGSASVALIIKGCADVLVKFEAEFVALLNVCVGIFAGGFLELCASIVLHLGLSVDVLAKLNLSLFAKLCLGGSVTVDLAAQFSAAITAAVAACEKHVVVIIAKCKTSDSAAIKVELQAILAIFVALKVKLEALISAGFKGYAAAKFEAELTACIQVWAKIVIAIGGSASATVIIKACADIIAQFEAVIVAIVKIWIGALGGCDKLIISICAKVGLTADLCVKLGLSAFLSVALKVAGGVVVSLDVQVKAAIKACVDACAGHVNTIVDHCKGKGNPKDVAAGIIVEIKAVIAAFVALKIKLEAFIKAGFKASAIDLKAELYLLLKVFVDICLAIKVHAGLEVARLCGSILVELDACVVVVLKLFIGCLHGFVALALHIFAELGLSLQACLSLQLHAIVGVIFH